MIADGRLQAVGQDDTGQHRKHKRHSDMKTPLPLTPGPVLCGCLSDRGQTLHRRQDNGLRGQPLNAPDDISNSYLMPLAHQVTVDQTFLLSVSQPSQL